MPKDKKDEEIAPVPEGAKLLLASRSRTEILMEMSTWITMILIMGFVWGGSALLLGAALRKESKKPRE